MQFIGKILGGCLILFIASLTNGQSVYLPQDNKHAQFLNRLEIMLRDNLSLNVSTPKPLSRKLAVETAEEVCFTQSGKKAQNRQEQPLLQEDSINDSSLTALSASRLSGQQNADLLPSLSPIDQYNLHSLLMNNSEWVTGDKASFKSKKNLWNTFYTTKANFVEINEKDFFLAINPVLQEQQSVETGNSERIFLNSRGVSLRGLIARRVGFYTYLVENLERAPLFVQERILNTRAIPGAGRYNSYKLTGVDYSDARGGVTFNAAKYIDFQFAYDKNFIGNGYRSLFLSDFGASYLFLKVNTKIWKFNYQNIFMELNPQFPQATRDGDVLLDKKYAAIHHLSINATPWLNLGLFEAVIFGRKNHFDFTYLNPIIFLRTAEKQNNSPDNGLVGFDLKANIAHKAQVYGQLMLDELIIKELRAGNGWYGNKFGIQLGGKYIDLFKIKNLDLQAELNLVRPFTYSHYDSTDSYGHYNQPLAHPLGANFIEAIGIIRYQPLPKLTTSARLILWKQGVDTGNANYGSNIFKRYTTRSAGDYGYRLPSGTPATGVNLQLLAAYEIRENIYFDASVMLRNWSAQNDLLPKQHTKMFTLGFRMNMFRREYDY